MNARIIFRAGTESKPKPCLILLFAALLFAANPLSAGRMNGDSTRRAYSTNDPQNPDCPCHKNQKLAEEEYALLKNAKRKSSDAGTRIPEKTFPVQREKHHLRKKQVLFKPRLRGIPARHIRKRRSDPGSSCPLWSQ